ncbi:ATP-binding protein, partial [Streptomyces sp. NPDC005921]
MGARSLTLRPELLDAARAELRSRPGVLLHGPAGIGKSTLVAALTANATGTVLRCSPADEDARLPFAGLVDLFSRVPDSRLDALAPTGVAARPGAGCPGPSCVYAPDEN